MPANRPDTRLTNRDGAEMSRRKRLTLGLFVCTGIGSSGFALMLLTALDRVVPNESLQAATRPTSAMVQNSMSQGATIALFLVLAMALIGIALSAGAVEQRRARVSVLAPPRVAVRSIRRGRNLCRRLQRQTALW
jgi:hypothetical protein